MGRIYLDTNGITVKCEGCEVGFKGILNGEEYEVVDNELLRKRKGMYNGMYNWRLVTSMVTDMSGMFFRSEFNQPIGNWDVSRVKRMKDMFMGSKFNQPIGNWDVSSVTCMSSMFRRSKFNQPIDDWNVSWKKTWMDDMFLDCKISPIPTWYPHV